MPGNFKDNWNEFEWERELRKDDERVAAYMDELPRYIDLPAEDAVILKHIQEKPGLVPPDGDYTGTFLDNMFEPEEEEIDFTDDWQKKDGADFYIAAGRLARLWALCFAEENSPEIVVPGMRILCLYGKIMARSGDLIDMEDGDYIPLRIALLKRLLADVNSLMGEFSNLPDLVPAVRESAEFHYENLMTFRDKLLGLLKKYRRKSPAAGK